MLMNGSEPSHNFRANLQPVFRPADRASLLTPLVSTIMDDVQRFNARNVEDMPQCSVAHW